MVVSADAGAIPFGRRPVGGVLLAYVQDSPVKCN